MKTRSGIGLTFVSLLLLIGLLLSFACSTSSASNPLSTPVSGAHGQPVQLTLRNTGVAQHDFTLTDGVAQPVKITAAGGQTASGTFTIESPGTYTFECSMPGHAAAGMQGSLTAE